MTELVAVAFENETGAAELCTALVDLQEQGLVTLDDAAMMIHQADGKIGVKQACNLVVSGASGGVFWGMLIGFMFWGTSTGLVSGELGDARSVFWTYGLDWGFVREARATIRPGHSALFMLICAAVPDKLIDALRQFNGRIIQSSLSCEEEIKLKESFGVCIGG